MVQICGVFPESDFFRDQSEVGLVPKQGYKQKSFSGRILFLSLLRDGFYFCHCFGTDFVFLMVTWFRDGFGFSHCFRTDFDFVMVSGRILFFYCFELSQGILRSDCC